MIEEMYLIILSAIVVILFVALIILTYKVFSLQNSIEDKNNQQIRDKKSNVANETINENHEQEEKVQDNISTKPKATVRLDINITDGARDINESMKRFIQKYMLDSATLASMDGFSLASSHSDSEKEAANLAARYQENTLTEIGDTHIIPLRYRSEEILMIIRTATTINPEQKNMMKHDGDRILTKWL